MALPPHPPLWRAGPAGAGTRARPAPPGRMRAGQRGARGHLPVPAPQAGLAGWGAQGNALTSSAAALRPPS